MRSRGDVGPCLHAVNVDWGEIALSSSVGVRTRLLSSLPLFNCVATSTKTPAAKKFLECTSALQHLYWHVTPHSACRRPSWVRCWLLTASWGLKWLTLTFRQVRLFLSLQQNVKKKKQNQQHTKKTNLSLKHKPYKTILKNPRNQSISDVCVWGFFFPFLSILS